MTDRLLLAQISVDVRDIQKQMQRAGLQVDTASRRMATTWRANTQSMTRDTEQFGRDVRRALASIALASVATDVTSLADAWTRAGNQISAAAQATGTAGVSLSTIADIARDTRVEFEATATLYARLTRATGDLGVSQEQVIAATRLINQAFVAGGASAQEQASAITQLSQALSSGVLQGDELRSLRESSPLLLAAIAKEFGVAQGALKALGAEGKLTSDRIFSAILKAAPEIEAQFSVTQSTVADSFTNLRTAAIEYAGTLGNSLGATEGLGNVVNALADNFETLADAILISAVLLGSRGLGAALSTAVTDFGRYVLGIGQRRSELIRQLEAEAEATKLQARQAALAISDEEKNLANLKRAREEAARGLTGDDRAIIQQRNLAKARSEVAAATDNLDRVNKRSKVTEEQREAAIRRLTIAQGNLNALEKTRIVDVAKLDTLDQRITASTQNLTRAKNEYTIAQQRAAAAARALGAAQNTVARAGSALLGLFGGPLGLVLTAIGAGFAYVQYEAIRADRAVRNVNEALSILSEGYATSEGLAMDAANASKQLTAELQAQKDAVVALAEVERQERRDQYIKGIEGARERVEKLTSELGWLTGASDGLNISLEYGTRYFGKSMEEREAAAAGLRTELESMTRYLRILEAGLPGLERSGFEKPKTSTEIATPPSGTPGPGGQTEEEKREAEEAAKLRARLELQAGRDAEDLIERIRGAWAEFYTWRDEQIAADLQADLDAIEKSALSAEEKEEARTKSREIASAKMREYLAEEVADAEEAEKAKQEAAEREIDSLNRILDERDRMLGRFISISAREYEARRKDIEANIKDEARRNQALAALAAEEAEFRRQVRAEAFGLDQRSDTGSQIALVQEEMAKKLAFIKEAQDLELAALAENEEAKLALLQEYEALRREIIADSEAEIQAIRTEGADALLNATASLFAGLAGLARSFAGENSAIFKALFFAEKAFALASAYVNMQLAIAKANASAPPPFNAAAILKAKVTGAAAIAGILASTAAGFKKGGYTGDGAADEVAGVVHRGEMVFDKRATQRLGKTNLEALRTGRLNMASIAAPVAPPSSRPVSFGDMILNVSGDGAAEIRDELAGMLAAHRQAVARDIDRGFGNTLAREMKSITPRHERRRT